MTLLKQRVNLKWKHLKVFGFVNYVLLKQNVKALYLQILKKIESKMKLEGLVKTEQRQSQFEEIINVLWEEEKVKPRR